MSNSKLVYAIKYELQVPINVKGGIFSTTGQKKKVKEGLVDRTFVKNRIEAGYKRDDDGKVIEGRRSNNELYVIDEEKTSELMKQRDANIIKKAEIEKKEKLGQSDLVDAIRNIGTPQPTQKTVDQTEEIERLKAENKKVLKELKEKKAEKVTELPKEKEVIADEEVNKAPDYSEKTLDELRAICDKKGIVYHHLAKEAKLIELINS